MQAADRLGGRAGQRHVDAVGREADVELGGLELGAAALDQRLERLARLVGGAAHDAALLGRELRDAAQEVGQLGLAAEVLHADVLDLVGGAGARQRLLGLGPQFVDPVGHGHGLVTS